MVLSGEQRIARPQAEVWRALNDPEILKACIPGCEALERIDEGSYRVALTAAIGPVRAKFTGKLVLADVKPPRSYALVFEGSGGAAGFGKGSAQVELSEEGGATRLLYSAKASVGGKLAQIGSRLVDTVSRKMADEFFQRFNENMAPKSAAAAAAPPARRVPYRAYIIGAGILLALGAVAYLLGRAG